MQQIKRCCLKVASKIAVDSGLPGQQHNVGRRKLCDDTTECLQALLSDEREIQVRRRLINNHFACLKKVNTALIPWSIAAKSSNWKRDSRFPHRTKDVLIEDFFDLPCPIRHGYLLINSRKSVVSSAANSSVLQAVRCCTRNLSHTC
jgi:hypothetical protein